MSEKERNIPIVIVILLYLGNLLGVVAFGEPTVEGIVRLTLATVITIVAIRSIQSS